MPSMNRKTFVSRVLLAGLFFLYSAFAGFGAELAQNATPPVLHLKGWTFDLVAQRDTKGNLYVGEEWALAPMGDGRPRWENAGLGAIIAIVQRARGVPSYQIGEPGSWSDLAGSLSVFGIKLSEAYSFAPKVSIIRRELRGGNPVILRGTSAPLGDKHYMLAFALDADDRVFAIDPWSASVVVINTRSWVLVNDPEKIEFEVINLRKIDMVP